MARSGSNGSLSFNLSAMDGKGTSAMLPLASPTRTPNSGLVASAKAMSLSTNGSIGYDKNQGDKLNDQKYMRYSRNKASVPSGGMLW